MKRRPSIDQRLQQYRVIARSYPGRVLHSTISLSLARIRAAKPLLFLVWSWKKNRKSRSSIASFRPARRERFAIRLPPPCFPDLPRSVVEQSSTIITSLRIPCPARAAGFVNRAFSC